VSLVLDLHIAHDRFGRRSDPNLNEHLHYPNDIDRSVNETAVDKIRKHRSDYNNNPPNTISFMSIFLVFPKFVRTPGFEGVVLKVFCWYLRQKKKMGTKKNGLLCFLLVNLIFIHSSTETLELRERVSTFSLVIVLIPLLVSLYPLDKTILDHDPYGPKFCPQIPKKIWRCPRFL
jgi:hypothetical protein